MPRALLLNHCVLFLCTSIYVGIGIFMLFFLFPMEPRLTPDNYAMLFVDPVANATSFLTWMTILMFVTALVMLATEWFTGLRWVPVIVLLGLSAATLLTMYALFPYNRELTAGITDPERLKHVFSNWACLNRIRISLWFVQWLAMMYWFYRMALQARADR